MDKRYDIVVRVAKDLKGARELLKGIGTCPWEGINANIRRALISVDQALFSMGEEVAPPDMSNCASPEEEKGV